MEKAKPSVRRWKLVRTLEDLGCGFECLDWLEGRTTMRPEWEVHHRAQALREVMEFGEALRAADSQAIPQDFADRGQAVATLWPQVQAGAALASELLMSECRRIVAAAKQQFGLAKDEPRAKKATVAGLVAALRDLKNASHCRFDSLRSLSDSSGYMAEWIIYHVAEALVEVADFAADLHATSAPVTLPPGVASRAEAAASLGPQMRTVVTQACDALARACGKLVAEAKRQFELGEYAPY